MLSAAPRPVTLGLSGEEGVKTQRIKRKITPWLILLFNSSRALHIEISDTHLSLDEIVQITDVVLKIIDAHFNYTALDCDECKIALHVFTLSKYNEWIFKAYISMHHLPHDSILPLIIIIALSCLPSSKSSLVVCTFANQML